MMTASFERSVKEALNDKESEVGRNETSGESKDVSIVVLASERRELLVPAKSAAYIGVLVGSHRDTIARATDNNAAGELSAINSRGERMDKVGIVDAIGRKGAEIMNLKTVGDKVIDDRLFKFKTSVIGGDRNNFVHFI